MLPETGRGANPPFRRAESVPLSPIPLLSAAKVSVGFYGCDRRTNRKIHSLPPFPGYQTAQNMVYWKRKKYSFLRRIFS
ncbi:hypothetical protein B4135_1071 [Caldibacillus debilis]|uniref:Uncharacterized protein n=1 Tax=Caldibacillus debilis TaxID=301148 RepID=A0A150MEM4_9BACI|nr:hypothetical protein B4135_1071 [Caldibacillus debilis]MBO2480691.1 hypothetical protein [Bacillaceae bacterium]